MDAGRQPDQQGRREASRDDPFGHAKQRAGRIEAAKGACKMTRDDIAQKNDKRQGNEDRRRIAQKP